MSAPKVRLIELAADDVRRGSPCQRARGRWNKSRCGGMAAFEFLFSVTLHGGVYRRAGPRDSMRKLVYCMRCASTAAGKYAITPSTIQVIRSTPSTIQVITSHGFGTVGGAVINFIPEGVAVTPGKADQ